MYWLEMCAVNYQIVIDYWKWKIAVKTVYVLLTAELKFSSVKFRQTMLGVGRQSQRSEFFAAVVITYLTTGK